MTKTRMKVDVVRSIALMLGVDPPRMSTGSTEPREIFALVNDRLGLGIRDRATKPELARGIVEASGNLWAPDYESTGATITREGLEAVEAAVQFFLGLTDEPRARAIEVRPDAWQTDSGTGGQKRRRLDGVNLSDYLTPSHKRLVANWLDILEREWPSPGKRQAMFTPVETLMSLGASLRVRHNAFGGETAELAPSPVPELARLFKRPPSSILAKMANLDGSRPNGGKFDGDVGTQLGSDLQRLGEVYRQLLCTARECGIGAADLPDFLGCEHGGTPSRPIDY